MSDLGAAFGFYPQLNRRRQGNPADSANLPVDVLRGRLAGLLGLPADMANLLRSPSPTEMFGDVSYEAPAQFPYTTEKFLKDLPLAPISRVGQVAGQAASFAPLNPMPAVRGVQKVGQVVGEELAATMMGQRPNSMMSKVVPQPLFAVAPEGLLSTKAEPIESLLQVKPQAPVSDIGFYSATEQAALNLGRNKGTGQSFINDLMKAPDVKKEELQFTGLDEFLRDKPNVTKQEVQDFLANNRVDVQEVTYGAQIAEDPIGIAKRKEVFDRYEPEIQDLYRRIDKPEYVVYDAETNTVLKNYTNYDDALLDNLDPMGAFSKARTGLRPRENSRQLQQQITDLQNLRDAQADAVYKIPESTPTKFGRYQLAGGENYREILLTLPQKETRTPNMIEYEKLGNQMFGGALNPAEMTRFNELQNLLSREERSIALSRGKSNTAIYQSSHFDEPNILAHMRVNDRVDADGKKMLLVEEIQSDWHQAGREKGYKGKGILKELPDNYFVQELKTIDGDTMYVVRNVDNPSVVLNKDYNRQSAINGVINELNASSVGGVPDAPFKDTWYQLALKRLTKYAAENGYERIGLTTGKQQAKRFDLGNEVNSIDVESVAGVPNLQLVDVDVIGGKKIALEIENGVVREGEFAGKRLSDVVGKEMADKITNVAQGEAKIFAGEDLRIGGEGMKKYYDEIYPKFLDKYGKKYGASVGETKVNTVMERADNSMIPKMGQEPVRYLDITPQMKEGTSKGQPLFAATPLLPATSLLDEEKRKEITSLLE